MALLEYDGIETTIGYTTKGKYMIGRNGESDLMMVGEKKEGWVNLYRVNNGEIMTGNRPVSKTREEALENSYNAPNYITTIKIEWEE